MKGIIFSFIAAFFWSLNAIFIRKATEQGNSLCGTYITLWVNIACIIPIAILMGEMHFPNGIHPYSFACFGIAGIFNYILGRSLYYLGIEHIGASRASTIAGSDPFFGIIFALIFLREILTWKLAVGISLLLLGLYIVITEEIRK